MWRLTRRALLWILPLVGGLLGLPWGIRDLQLLTDVFGVRGITYPRQQCVKNLAKILKLADDCVRANEEVVAGDDLPSQPECWKLLATRDPSITALECPLVHNPVRAYWQRPLSLPADPHSSYVINPRIFTRPSRMWKDSDIVAADSQPRHFSDLRGPGIRCIFLVKWDGSTQTAYFDEHQEPSLIRQIDDFANGIEGNDHDKSWRQYYSTPHLDLTREYALLYIHLGVLGVMAVVWLRLLLTHPTKA